MGRESSERLHLWPFALFLLVGVLVVSQIASFWLIFQLREKCIASNHEESTINVASTARILNAKVNELFGSNGRNRRQAESDAERTLLHAFMDVLKQLCAPNERYCMLGPKGDQGLRGHPGFPGQTGANGEPGKHGKRGNIGKQGPKGERGDIGPVGGQGVKGEQGLQGINGRKGDQGSTGYKGERGEVGKTGSRGDIGPAGGHGVKGEQGLQGMNGRKGDQGSTGEKGEVGKMGSRGVQGIKGEKGENGIKGDKGKDLQCPSECYPWNHKVLSDEWRKISVSSKGKTIHCDRNLAPGWYRFSESIGGQMNTKCVPEGWRCGTAATSWLVGSHPSTVGSKVSREVHYGYASSCKFANKSANIQILNCASFYIYYLQKTSGCDYAYCSGA